MYGLLRSKRSEYNVLRTRIYLGMSLLIFSLQVRSNDGPISQFGNVLFWLMVADVLYRAATKENTETAGGNGSSDGSGASEGSGRRWRLRRGGGGQSTMMVSFEDALMKRHTPRE